jgi:hypothetical protein
MREAHDRLGSTDRADAASVSQTRSKIIDDGLQLSAISHERAPGVAHGQGDPSDLGLPHGVLAAGIAWASAAGQAGENGIGERAAGELAVGVVAGQ